MDLRDRFYQFSNSEILSVWHNHSREILLYRPNVEAEGKPLYLGLVRIFQLMLQHINRRGSC